MTTRVVMPKGICGLNEAVKRIEAKIKEMEKEINSLKKELREKLSITETNKKEKQDGNQ